MMFKNSDLEHIFEGMFELTCLRQASIITPLSTMLI